MILKKTKNTNFPELTGHIASKKLQEHYSVSIYNIHEVKGGICSFFTDLEVKTKRYRRTHNYSQKQLQTTNLVNRI